MPGVCLSVCLSVCVSVYWQFYVITIEPIFVKMLPEMYPRTRKNWLNSGSRSVPDSDPGTTMRDRTFFHSFAHISGKTNILPQT